MYAGAGLVSAQAGAPVAARRPALQRRSIVFGCTGQLSALGFWARGQAKEVAPPSISEAAPGAPPPFDGALPPLEPVGDGLDSLRAEIRVHTSRSREQKLADALRTLQEDEAGYLRSFRDARERGDQRGMDVAHDLWVFNTKQLKLLRRDPETFIRRNGFLFGFGP